jgi:hypothetical protein
MDEWRERARDGRGEFAYWSVDDVGGGCTWVT